MNIGLTLTVDLHGMTVSEARATLLRELKSCPKTVSEIDVIHGFKGGQELLKMVRSFSHPRIERKILGLNNGSTTFKLRNF